MLLAIFDCPHYIKCCPGCKSMSQSMSLSKWSDRDAVASLGSIGPHHISTGQYFQVQASGRLVAE